MKPHCDLNLMMESSRKLRCCFAKDKVYNTFENKSHRCSISIDALTRRVETILAALVQIVIWLEYGQDWVSLR